MFLWILSSDSSVIFCHDTKLKTHGKDLLAPNIAIYIAKWLSLQFSVCMHIDATGTRIFCFELGVLTAFLHNVGQLVGSLAPGTAWIFYNIFQAERKKTPFVLQSKTHQQNIRVILCRTSDFIKINQYNTCDCSYLSHVM